MRWWAALPALLVLQVTPVLAQVAPVVLQETPSKPQVVPESDPDFGGAPLSRTIALAEAVEDQQAAEPAPPAPRLTGAAWCSAQWDADADEGTWSGCDVGVGAALFARRWGSVVTVVGLQTAGLGVAFVARRPSPGEDGPVIAVGVGVVAPYDEQGVHLDRWSVAIGPTFGFGGERP